MRVSRGEARHRLQHAELLTTVAGQAARAGIIGNEHVTVITTMLQAIPADVPSEVREIAEHTLVTEAGTQDPAVVSRHAQRLLARIDQDGREPDVRELLQID